MRYTIIMTPASDINNVSTICGEASFNMISDDPKLIEHYIFEPGAMINLKGDWLDENVEVAKIEFQGEKDKERRMVKSGQTYVTYNVEENKFSVKYFHP